MLNEYLNSFKDAVQKDEIFLFLAQLNPYKFGMGRPGYDWRSMHKEAYENGLIQFVEDHPEKQDLVEKEVESILRQMTVFDYLHDYLRTYLAVEVHFRQIKRSRFQFKLEPIFSELQKAEPPFAAQYDSDLKKTLKPQDISDALLTGTGGRIVSLKDYLFHIGPSSQISERPLLDHKGRKINWF